ncbi:type II CRISPR RNA-guided endonuclease Cas9 [Paracoccus bogoriensis]|uniref:type II CRISPR RNA-guided endonuclease Cas9 n=1 Tax=Paracoccus bogoriensis TaxID=242065 RepID=UPI001CA4DDAE|nr:type II CRISPR RNA-guided endonuclease Cas9 [Paracoccus bogoriensis]MBW7057793.1 type II CRISPR RNA-guided endonuclease Cas9 [Paracoccus bogoriensis]
MYRFAFDLGTHSLGWAVYRLDDDANPVSLEKLGVRIFPNGRDPQSKQSKAAGRRGPRSSRRQQDRRLARRRRLLGDLIAFGLLPSDADARSAVFATNPIEARAKAAQGQVALEQLGRALWHISKHRGFKSNRRANNDADESGKIATASNALIARLKSEGHPTYGAFLNARLARGEATRIRPTDAGANLPYAFYPTRALLEAEFDHIWATQAAFHPSFTDDKRERLRDTIFFQRPLRPVRPGKCTFFPDRDRLPRWHPAAQEFLILSQLNHLRIVDDDGEQPLDITARDLVARTLMRGTKLSWAALRKTLKLPRQAKFNLERGGLKELARNEVAARLLGDTKKPGPLAAFWPLLDSLAQVEMLGRIADAADAEELVNWLMERHGLSDEIAAKVEKIPLPDGHLRFCLTATQAILDEMRKDVITYDEAVRRAPLLGGAGLDHADFQAAEGAGILPPYNRLPVLQRMIGNGTGDPNDPDLLRYGRITNPTVHIALGQFRRVMNALIAEYGKPAQVAIEAARDMAKSADELKRIESDIGKNTKRNDRWRKELQEAGLLDEGARIGDRFLRMRLWEELGKNPADRVCPYTGQPIALHQLHSDEIEIDHILPFEETFDDSPANKTVCFRYANRIKGKRAPGDAWSGDDLAAITARTKHLPANKAWRFLPGAMKKWEETRGFEDRQLNATGYLARVVRAYAESLFPKTDDAGKRRSHVWVLPGRMTAMLRQRWCLNLGDHNRKSRDDHRHHAIDAAVVGVIDRRMIQVLQAHARKMGVERLDRVLPAPPEPFQGFRAAVLRAVEKVNVSHRAQHGSADPSDPSQTSGRLHEDTVYGLIRDVPENQADRTIGNVVVRKPVLGLTEKEIGQVRDVKLRLSLQEATRSALDRSLPKAEREKRLPEALAAWSKETGHRKLRILKPEAAVRPVHDREGRPYKWLVPGENAYLDILEGPDGAWFQHVTDIWAANSGGAEPWNAAHPDARFIMRVHKNDTIQLFDWDDKSKCVVEGSNRIKRIIRLSPSNSLIYLVSINDAGNFQKRHEDADDPFRWDLANIGKLKLRRARRVRIDELGRVHTIPHGTI